MSRPAGAPRKPSLSSRLLRRAMLPLALTWALGAAIAVWVGDIFTEQAFDRSLLDDAYVVSSHVEQGDAGLELSMTGDEVDAVLFDQSETMYFAVISDEGLLLAGQPGLDDANMPEGGAQFAFGTLQHDGQRLRTVVLKQRDAPGFRVVIAQTTTSRVQLLQRLVAYAIVPQLLLLAVVAFALRRVVRRDLAPLAALQHTLDARDAGDLTPMPAALAREAGTREVERVGVAIDALLGRVSDGVQAQREFAGNVAHELRTPLAGIRALAEYGLAQSDPRVQRQQLQAIVESQARASHLIDQLLALALADEARESLALEPIALDVVAREVLLRFLPRADQAGVDLGAQGLDTPVQVMGNAALVEGLLGNLIDNALRHGQNANGRAPVVTLELTQHAGEVRLAVVDNGPGLSADERGSLQQRWAQGGGNARTAGGAGLGLAIVARYAALLGARFELGEAPGAAGLHASVVFEPLAR